MLPPEITATIFLPQNREHIAAANATAPAPPETKCAFVDKDQRACAASQLETTSTSSTNTSNKGHMSVKMLVEPIPSTELFPLSTFTGLPLIFADFKGVELSISQAIICGVLPKAFVAKSYSRNHAPTS